MTSATALDARLCRVRERIERAGRGLDEVRIVAVTKGFGLTEVAAAIDAGLTDLGENYAQELIAKADRAPGGTRWHFLGPVQRNKVKGLAPHVALWHGIDRVGAGAEIARWPDPAPVLVQVNLAGDPGRPGASWSEAPALVDALRDLGLDVRGLMGVASRPSLRPSPSPDDVRQQFRRLAVMAGRLELGELSMGMSGDLEVAVEEGATMVRVGTALFGSRHDDAQARR